MHFVIILLAALALGACGGGDNGVGPTPTPSPTVSPTPTPSPAGRLVGWGTDPIIRPGERPCGGAASHARLGGPGTLRAEITWKDSPGNTLWVAFATDYLYPWSDCMVEELMAGRCLNLGAPLTDNSRPKILEVRVRQSDLNLADPTAAFQLCMYPPPTNVGAVEDVSYNVYFTDDPGK